MRKLVPQTPQRIAWEQRIITKIENVLEVSTSDAQGLIEAQSDILENSWSRGELAVDVADKIIGNDGDQPEKEVQHKKEAFTYDGNENNNYEVFRDGKKIMEVFLGEDEVIHLVKILNELHYAV